MDERVHNTSRFETNVRAKNTSIGRNNENIFNRLSRLFTIKELFFEMGYIFSIYSFTTM